MLKKIKLNPPIKYFGGKGTMYKQIIKHFPENYSIYIEPFGGSYSVGLRQDKKCLEIYNDLEKNVYSLYKVLSDSVFLKHHTIYSNE